VRELAPEAAHDVAVGLAEGVREAIVALVAEDRGQRVGCPQARGRELDLLDWNRVFDIAAEAEPLANSLRRLLQLRPRRLLLLEAPTPVLAAPGRGAYQ
jgi:hypothetical protein